ncbi:hypothetical protein M9Y10_018804 [Tritrichomonas musculus]|uniref:Calpain catalytic domain-containing protein n=1 Tax=Tritrichomonas musculus TaxID=1915356 RepID=A0ABR2HHS3_9EUKA
MESKKYKDFKQEAQQLKSILNKYKKTGEPFVDPNFHPTAKIIERDYDCLKGVEGWVRVDEYYNAPLFKEDLINPDFVGQGGIGDCYFVAALSLVAKHPYLVPSLFEFDTPNRILGKQEDSINIKCGAVVVYFHCFGRRTPVLIDTLVPTIYGQFKHSRPLDKSQSPWFCLVEKAFAKLNGSYSDIVGGDITQSIYNLFGYYPMVKKFEDLSKSEKISKMSIFERIMKYQKQGGVMGTSIDLSKNQNGVTSDEIKNKGLIAKHCYLLLKAREHDNKHFLCLRNPHGKNEWSGDWSDKSPLWTEELKEGLGWRDAEDGTFWMIEKDFLRYFTDVSVAKPIRPKWYARRYSVQLQPGDHDGYDIESKEGKANQLPNFAFKITEPIGKDEKVHFHILVEKRNKLFNEEKSTLFASPFCEVYTIHNQGQKFDLSTCRYRKRSSFSHNANVFSTRCDAVGNDDIITIIIHREQKCDLFEDCYILVYCEKNFDLYDIDKPEITMPVVKNTGLVFDNFSVRHPDVAPPLKPTKNRYDEDVIDFGELTKTAFDPSRAERLANQRKRLDAFKSGLYKSSDEGGTDDPKKKGSGKSKAKDKDDTSKSKSKDDDGKSKSKDNDGKSKSKDDDGKSKSKDNDGKSKSKDDDGKSKSKDDDGKSKSKDDDGKSKSKDDYGKSKSKDDDGKSKSKDDDGKSKSKDDGKSKSKDDDGKSKSKDDGKSKSKDDDGKSKSKDDDGKSKSKDDGKSKSKDDTGKSKDGSDAKDREIAALKRNVAQLSDLLKKAQKEKEDAVKAKDREKESAIRAKNQEKEDALRAKEQEKEEALRAKEQEKEAVLRAKDQEKEDALKAKDTEKANALRVKNREINSLKKENEKLKSQLDKAKSKKTTDDDALRAKDQEKEEALRAKEQEMEEALRAKEQEKEEALRAKDQEKEDALKAKDTEKANALRVKNREINSLKKENEKLKSQLDKAKSKKTTDDDALKAKEQEMQDALRAKEQEKEDALKSKDREISNAQKENQRLANLLKKLEKEKEELLKRLEDKSEDDSVEIARLEVSGGGYDDKSSSEEYDDKASDDEDGIKDEVVLSTDSDDGGKDDDDDDDDDDKKDDKDDDVVTFSSDDEGDLTKSLLKSSTKSKVPVVKPTPPKKKRVAINKYRPRIQPVLPSSGNIPIIKRK